MLHQSRQSKKLVPLTLLVVFIMACDAASHLIPSSSTVPIPDFTPAPFVPGEPTATPLGSEITDPNFITGLEAFNAEDYDQTVALMSAVIESNPNLAPPYRYRATSYWYLDDCESGLVDAEKAISINPNYAAAWAARGLMYFCLGNDARALQSYEQALAIDPSLSVIHHNLGVYYYDRGDYQKSLDEYTLSATIDPTRSGAWGGIGEALAALERFEECIEYETKAIEVDAEEWLAYSDRAFCYTRMENHAAAAADYKIYVAQIADDATAWYNYGIAQSNSGDPQGALAAYTRSLELDPEYPPAYINRGHVYNELQQYQAAIDDFNTALTFGEMAFAYSGRGDTYYWMEQYEQAIADYKTALSMYPSAHCHCFLAFSYFELERYQEVLDEAQASKDIDPSCADAKLFEVEARTYYALEDYEQALVHINKALELDQYSLGYYYRGIIYQAVGGKNQEAIQDLELFLSVSTNFPEEIADAEARLTELKK